MSLTTIINITIGRPRAKRLFISPVGRSTSVIASYTAPAGPANVQVDSARSIDQFYSSRAATRNVTVDADIDFVEAGYVSSALARFDSINTDIDRFAGYISPVNSINIVTSENVIERDDSPPGQGLGNLWGTSIENLRFNGWDFVLDTQASDDQTPQGALKYGMFVATSGAEYVNKLTAAQSDPNNYDGFVDIKTGGELTANGNRLFYNGGDVFDTFGNVIEYRTNVVVWDDYGNSSVYNLQKDIILPELEIVEFYINEDSLVLNVNEEGTLSVTNESIGGTGNVSWESLSPGVAESLGNGVFLGLTVGQTGARVTSADDPSFSATVPIFVEEYQQIVPGEENEFETGPDNFKDAAYNSPASAVGVVVDVFANAVLSADYNSPATVSGPVVSSSVTAIPQVDLDADNEKLSEYSSTTDGDNEGLAEYAAPNTINASYESGATATSAQVNAIVYADVINSAYSSPASATSVSVASEVGTFIPFVEGEDNAFISEYGADPTGDNEAITLYDESIVISGYSSPAMAVNAVVSSTTEPINEFIDASYTSPASAVSVQTQQNLIPLFVDSDYVSGTFASNVQTDFILDLVVKTINASYSSPASASNVLVASTFTT